MNLRQEKVPALVADNVVLSKVKVSWSHIISSGKYHNEIRLFHLLGIIGAGPGVRLSLQKTFSQSRRSGNRQMVFLVQN